MKISNFHLAIGIPLSFPFVHASFFHSFIMMDRPSFTYLHADNGGASALRNNLVEKALEVGASHLCMMDTDQVYHPNTITSLLSHKLPVVGALVHRKYAPFDSLMLKLVEVDDKYNAYESIDEWEDGALIEVDAMGGGCTMFNMEVFRNLPYPWYRDDTAPPGSPPIGEDIALCQSLKKAGYKLYVDTSVPAGHLATLVVNTATNRLYRSIDNKKAIYQALKIDDNRDSDVK